MQLSVLSSPPPPPTEERTYIGLVEEKPELSFRLPNPLVEAVRALPHEEGHLAALVGALGSEGARQQGFARSGRAVEKNWKRWGKGLNLKSYNMVLYLLLFCPLSYTQL